MAIGSYGLSTVIFEPTASWASMIVSFFIALLRVPGVSADCRRTDGVIGVEFGVTGYEEMPEIFGGVE